MERCPSCKRMPSERCCLDPIHDLADRAPALEADLRVLHAFERLIRESYLPDEEADILMAQARVEASRHETPI